MRPNWFWGDTNQIQGVRLGWDRVRFRSLTAFKSMTPGLCVNSLSDRWESEEAQLVSSIHSVENQYWKHFRYLHTVTFRKIPTKFPPAKAASKSIIYIDTHKINFPKTTHNVSLVYVLLRREIFHKTMTFVIHCLYYGTIMFSTLLDIQKSKDRAPINRWDTSTCCDLHHLLAAEWTMGDERGLYCLSHIRSVPKPPVAHGSPVF